MTDHKFTDDEIIKALECCRTVDGNDCSTCPYRNKIYELGLGGCVNDLVTDALALINHQKVEIESLKIANEKMYAASEEQEAEIERLQAVHADMTESLRLASEANKDMQAEIKRLTTLAKLSNMRANDYRAMRNKAITARAEAIKEFAERLKANMSNIARMEYGGNIYFCVGYDLIDNLVKEMTEADDESQNT